MRIIEVLQAYEKLVIPSGIIPDPPLCTHSVWGKGLKPV